LLIAVSLYSFLSSNSLAIAYEQMYIDVCESLAKFQQNFLLSGQGVDNARYKTYLELIHVSYTVFTLVCILRIGLETKPQSVLL
jgi:hypothetical protein